MKGYRAHHNAYHNEPEEGSPGPNMSLDLCSDQRVDKQPKSQAEEGKKGNKAQYYLAMGCLIGAKSWILDLSGIFQLGLG